MTDYLAAEPLIVARIQAKVAGLNLKTVIDIANIEDAFEYQQGFPAVFVSYYGDIIGANAGDGAGQIVQQSYVVMPAVQNVRDTLGNSAARREVGPILFAVNEALLGWPPSADHGPLRKATSPRAPNKPGLAYFPQVFTTSVALVGDPT